jgi:hypothetical protein
MDWLVVGWWMMTAPPDDLLFVLGRVKRNKSPALF